MSDHIAAVARFTRALSAALLDLAADVETALPDPQPTEVEIPIGRGTRQQQISQSSRFAHRTGYENR
jgi:hypothetical protein